jgi:hypothetical protein
MNKEFIPYEEALALKELGFDEPCFGRYYYKELYPMLNPQSEETELVFEFGQYIKQTEVTILAPLYQQAFRWFREECNLLHIINIDLSDNLKDKVYVYSIEDHLGSIVDRSEEFKTYEEAELACLKKLIEIVNQNKRDE